MNWVDCVTQWDHEAPRRQILIPARGQHEVKLDAKGRFPMPARIRELIGEYGHKALVTAYWNGRLRIYSMDDWEQIELRWANDPEFSDEDALYAFIANAEEGKLDKSGRLRLPNHLREWADIANEAVIVGLGRIGVLEVWNPEAYQRRVVAARQGSDRKGDMSRLTIPMRIPAPGEKS